MKLLIRRLKKEGYVATQHKVEPNTVLGGTHTVDLGKFKNFCNPFTITQTENGFILRILGQLTLDERANTEDEVIVLLKKHRLKGPSQ